MIGYIDKTMLTIKTNLLKIEQAPVNKGTFIGTVVVRRHRHKSQSPTPGGGPDEYRR